MAVVPFYTGLYGQITLYNYTMAGGSLLECVIEQSVNKFLLQIETLQQAILSVFLL